MEQIAISIKKLNQVYLHTFKGSKSLQFYNCSTAIKPDKEVYRTCVEEAAIWIKIIIYHLRRFDQVSNRMVNFSASYTRILSSQSSPKLPKQQTALFFCGRNFGIFEHRARSRRGSLSNIMNHPPKGEAGRK